VTIQQGTNRLVGTEASAIESAVSDVLAGHWAVGNRPPLWDGQAAHRIVDIVVRHLAGH
jgi:UDP-N-acetylglucosamine 2-epimerase (non-hydrolysing)